MLVLAAVAALASSAQAATYTVGTTGDTPSGEKCPEPASGTCSLRQLIEYENGLPEAPSPPDVIVVPSGTYKLNEGTLTITQSLVILGAGARTTIVEMPVNAYPERERVFETQSPGESSIGIFGLEIVDGIANADSNEIDGDFGGDIRNKGLLLLSEDWITKGTASAGGGVANDGGTLVVERSLISGNTSSTGYAEAGGILNYGYAGCEGECAGKKAVLAVEDSTVAENSADVGAGIVSTTEDLEPDENGASIIDSTIAYNSEECIECSPVAGAGLTADDGTIAVDGSIVAFNTNTTSGGAPTEANCSATSPATIVSPSATTSRAGPTAASRPPGIYRTPLQISAPPPCRTTVAARTPLPWNQPAPRWTQFPRASRCFATTSTSAASPAPRAPPATSARSNSPHPRSRPLGCP